MLHQSASLHRRVLPGPFALLAQHPQGQVRLCGRVGGRVGVSGSDSLLLPSQVIFPLRSDSISFGCFWFSDCSCGLFLFVRDKNSSRTCYDTTSPELFDDFLVYSSIMSVLMFALPFMVVLVCNGLMVRKLLEFSRRTEGGAEGVPLSARRSKQKSVKMIIIILATFMLCFLPFHLTRSLYYSFRYIQQVSPEQVGTVVHANPVQMFGASLPLCSSSQITCNMLEAVNVAYKVTRPMASANSCLDPILYFLAGRDVRSNLTKKSRTTNPTAGSTSQGLTTQF